MPPTSLPPDLPRLARQAEAPLLKLGFLGYFLSQIEWSYLIEMQGGICNLPTAPGFGSTKRPPCPLMARASASSAGPWMQRVRGGHHEPDTDPDTDPRGLPTRLRPQQSHFGENSPFLQD